MASEERKSILVVTLSNLGDVILTTPVIASLRASFPKARMTVVVGPKASGLVEGSRLIDRILTYDKRAGWGHKLKLIRALRQEFYEYVVDLRNSALPFVVRADRRSPIFRSHRLERARDRHLEILKMMKLPDTNSASFDFFSEKEERSLLKKLGEGREMLSDSYVVVAPGAGSEAKRWPIESFQDVLRRLLPRFPLRVAVVGDQNETHLGKVLARADETRILNLTGILTLRELACLVSQARLVLTNDSAVMHLGYELHRPVVAIFAPTDHKRYGQEDEVSRIVRGATLQEVSRDKVFEACQGLLTRSLTPAFSLPEGEKE